MGKITVFISYNPVEGFTSGWHGKVFICANDAGYGRNTGKGRDGYQRAKSVMHKLSGKYYHGSVPVEDVRQYIVYAGLCAFDGAISMAKTLRSLAKGVPVTVAACGCDWTEKQQLLQGTDIQLISVECTGSYALGKMAQDAMGA